MTTKLGNIQSLKQSDIRIEIISKAYRQGNNGGEATKTPCGLGLRFRDCKYFSGKIKGTLVD